MNRTLIGIIASGLVVSVFLAVTLSVDHVAMRSIERYGSEALGTEVSVDDVTIRLAEGHGRISGLRVAQPDGFGAGDALAFGEIVLDFDVSSLADGDPYVLEVVRVADPVVFYVRREDGTSNVDVIQRNLAGADETGARVGASEAPSVESEDTLRLRIDRLEVAGGRIVADVRAAGVGEREANLPPIGVNGVGGKLGLPPEELATHIGRRFVSHALASVAAASVGDLVKRSGRELGGLLDKLLP